MTTVAKEIHEEIVQRVINIFNLKPTTESISLRLPGFMLMRIKELANAKDVPYQSLMKVYLAERIEQELKKQKRK